MIFRDVRASGAKIDRAQLRVIEALEPDDVLLEPDDVLMVTRLDRLARSIRDLLNTLAVIAAKNAELQLRCDAWANTGASTGRLMIDGLGGLADVERDLIGARTAEGRIRAKARGQHMGRPPKFTLQQQAEARRQRVEGTTLKGLAKSYNVGRATISRLGP